MWRYSPKLAMMSSEYSHIYNSHKSKTLICLESDSGTRSAFRGASNPEEIAMTDHPEYRFHRVGAEADRWLDRVRAYLSTRRAADWGFFLVGVVIGGLLF
jgi:hypothetical protein